MNKGVDSVSNCQLWAAFLLVVSNYILSCGGLIPSSKRIGQRAPDINFVCIKMKCIANKEMDEHKSKGSPAAGSGSDVPSGKIENSCNRNRKTT